MLTSWVFYALLSDMENLRRKQKKDFFIKMTSQVRDKLSDYLENEWAPIEIWNKFQFPMNRQAEIKNPEKYPKAVVGERLFIVLIGGRFMEIQELLTKTPLTENERRYLETFMIFEDEECREKYIFLKRAGHDPGKAFDEYIERYGVK